MSSTANQPVQDELARLERLHMLTASEREQLATRYPTTRWDVLVLVRWLTILGAVAVGVGVLLLAQELVTLMRFGELALLFALVGFAWLGRWASRVQGLPKTGAVLELLSGFALQGLTTLLALDFSTGSKNWPLLVGVQAALLTALAYGLANRLVLILALVCFFVFFGGETGYASNWGAYWLGMNYPLRFLAAGGACCGVAWYHARELRGAYQAFSRVYAHFGLLIGHLALWFFALFGFFDGVPNWSDTQAERLLFSALWAGVSLGCVWLAGPSGLRLLRGYGLTFLVLDLYTFYFQFIAFHSAELWWLHLLLVGGSLMLLGSRLERRLREHRLSDAG